jgi:hypothetical protein
MTSHAEFKLETRRYGDGHILCARIVCGYCNYEAWFPAKNGGWATRVCRSHGWKVGNKPAQHRCPKCFGRAMASRRTPDNPAIPKEIGKVIKTKLMEAHVKDALLGSSAITRHPEKPVQDPLYLSDLIVPVEPEKAPEPAPEPAPAPPAPEPEYLKPVRGQHSVPGRTQWRKDHRGDAASAATRATGSVDGLAFFTVPLGKGWTWKYAADVTEAEREEWLASRKYGARPTERTENSPLGPKPANGTTAPPPAAEETPPMNTVTPIRKDTMPATDPLTLANDIVRGVAAVEPPRNPTRDERAMIHDALTTAYDNVDQRYLKDGSDKALAEKLNVPRAWVADVRSMFFGDYDRNSETEKKKASLDAAINLAKLASTRLLEMASEADTLQRDLEAARKLMD